MRAVVYARYSSLNQDEASIDAQLRAINDFADKNNVKIVKVYIDEAKSATTDDRPQFLKMFDDLAVGVVQADFCYVHKFDRFARNRYDSAIYKRKLTQCGVRLIAVAQPLDDSPESGILEAMLEAMAEYYSKNLGREAMKGLNENALKGLHCGGIPPLGYDVGKDKKYIINETEAKTVKLIFKLRAENKSYSEIIDALKGHKTKRGKPFGKNSIHDILVNEKYLGHYIYNRGYGDNPRKKKSPEEVIIIKNAIPQIIDQETWDKVAASVAENKHATPKVGSNMVYILTGKIKCDDCGGSYVGNSRKGGKNKIQYYFYCCNERKRLKNGCKNVEIRKEIIENYVLDDIVRVFFNDPIEELLDKLERRYAEQNIELKEEHAQMQQRIINSRQVIDNLYRAIEKGLDTPETIARIKRLTAETEKMESALNEITSRLKIPYSRTNMIEFLEENKKAAIDRSDLAACKKVVYRFVDKIILTPEDIFVKYRFGCDADNGGSPKAYLTLSTSQKRAKLYPKK